ncbi:MAG: phosphoglucosamine mutase [Bacteriovoracaceae bacterium]
MKKRSLFGTDGIRGQANIFPMTGEVAFSLGRAVTSYFQGKNSGKMPLIIIGKDTRLSCYMLEQAFAAGVCSQGGRAILTGPLPTPGVAFVTQSLRADVGVMISASHNPYYDNGIKIFDRTGHKLPDNVELELEKMILDPSLIPVKLDAELGNAKRLEEVIGRYVVKTKAAFNSNYSLDGMRIAIDCANGAAYKLGPAIFEELGAEVIPIGVTPNGTNINTKCGALHPESCSENVIKYRADIGVCLDGDADRIVMIDHKGTVIDGDIVIGICAKFLKATGELGPANEVVGTVMSNAGLEYFLTQEGIKFTRTQVGDRYIVESMLNSSSLLGGEPSGHIIFKKYSTTGDGILAALKVIECMKYFNKTLAELAKEVELFPQVLKNVKVKNKIPFDEHKGIQAELKKAEAQLGSTGRVLLRYSGTENLARVMVEGKDKNMVHTICDHMAKVLEKEIG